MTEGGCWEGAEARSGDAAREKGGGSGGRRARGRWVTSGAVLGRFPGLLSNATWALCLMTGAHENYLRR